MTKASAIRGSAGLAIAICFLIAALEGYDIQAFGVAAPLIGVAGIEASVGVVMLSDQPVDDLGPKVLRAAGEVARALR